MYDYNIKDDMKIIENELKRLKEEDPNIDNNRALIQSLMEYTTVAGFINYDEMKQVEEYFTQNYFTTLNVADLAKIQAANSLYIDSEITDNVIFKNEADMNTINEVLNNYFKNDMNSFFVIIEDANNSEIKLIALNEEQHKDLLQTIANADNNVINIENVDKTIYVADSTLADIHKTLDMKDLEKEFYEITR